jgi:mycothiol synthase
VPENASIRHFVWSDLPAWTALVNELSGATGTDEAVDTDFKQRFLSQPSLGAEDNCFIAEVGEEAAGMARISHEPSISRAVADLAVLPGHRRRGVGRQLLDRAIERVRELDARVLHIQVPVLSRGGRFLLEDSGFYAARRYWRLAADAGGVVVPPLPSGYCVRPFALGADEPVLTELQNAAFAGSWGFAPNTVEEIAARVRMRPWEFEGILMLELDGTPCGYNWTQRPRQIGSPTGYIGMTGVHPDQRGKGLGRAIVAAGMAYLESKGARTVKLEVDHSNKPARELYLSLGFDLMEETVWYELNLSA